MIVSENFMMNKDVAYTVNTITELLKKVSNNDLKVANQLDINKEKLLRFVQTSHWDSANENHWWKKKEVALLLLGSFSNDIIFF